MSDERVMTTLEAWDSLEDAFAAALAHSAKQEAALAMVYRSPLFVHFRPETQIAVRDALGELKAATGG